MTDPIVRLSSFLDCKRPVAPRSAAVAVDGRRPPSSGAVPCHLQCRLAPQPVRPVGAHPWPSRFKKIRIRRHLEPQHHAAHEACERDELFAEPGSVNISKLGLEVSHVGVDVEPWSQSNEYAPACVSHRKRRPGRKRVERIF
jgi:hypothetical protein